MTVKPSTMVLRFRDFGVETIPAHEAVLKAKGSVWWGWWAKPQEHVPTSVFANFEASIKANGSLQIFLANSGNNTLYRATLVEIAQGKGDGAMSCPDLGLTPDYYSNRDFKAWYRLSSIEEIKEEALQAFSYCEVSADEFFDDPYSHLFIDKRVFDLAELLNRHHRTIYFLQAHSADHDSHQVVLTPAYTPANFATRPLLADSTYILHLSDVHFEKAHHGFNLPGGTTTDGTLLTHIEEMIEREFGGTPPAAVILSGDLTWSGSEDDFGLALRFLRDLKSVVNLSLNQFVVVPGNHDIQWTSGAAPAAGAAVDPVPAVAESNYRKFYKEFFGVAAGEFLSQGRRLVLGNFVSVDILGLNSARLEQAAFRGYGFVGLKQFEDGVKQLKWRGQDHKSDYRLAVLHHHLLPVTSQESAVVDGNFSLTLDATQILYRCLEEEIDLVLHGHQHQPFCASLSRAVQDSKFPVARSVAVHGAGSAGVVKSHVGDVGVNSFSAIVFSRTEVTVKMYASGQNAKRFESTWEAILSAKPGLGLRF